MKAHTRFDTMSSRSEHQKNAARLRMDQREAKSDGSFSHGFYRWLQVKREFEKADVFNTQTWWALFDGEDEETKRAHLKHIGLYEEWMKWRVLGSPKPGF